MSGFSQMLQGVTYVNRRYSLALAALCLTAPAAAQITSFQHVIIVVQENRTPDNMFQGLCTTSAACSTKPGPLQYNIQTTGWLDKTSPTGTTDPRAFPFGVGYDLSHSHYAFVRMCDLNTSGGCAMDGAAHVGCLAKSQPCPRKPAFGYIDNSNGAVQPYLDLVKAYGWGNYMFQTNQGPSFPAHQFVFGASSAPSAEDDHNGIFVAENPTPSRITGCIAEIIARVWLINPQGVEFAQIYPCFERQTLADLLDAQGLSWRYYGSAAGTWHGSYAAGIWMAPNAIKHICVPVGRKCTGKEWTSNVVVTPSAVLSDISTKCDLRNVSWVIPDGENSDHMGNVLDTGGPSWVASIVNAVGTSTCKNPDGSSYWSSTAIMVTWDDWGGWYDHERPTIEAYPQGGYQMGFRVPLIVVSAYTPVGFISNTPEDFGSIVRFIERNFGIMEGALTFADLRSTSNLTEFFSLGSPARTFQPINAPLSARDFLSAKPSGIPPDDY
jgi:phospholipase C